MRGMRMEVSVTRTLAALVVLGLLVSLTGCATIVDGGRESVSINSSPSGALVTVVSRYGSTVASQRTPCVVRLPRDAGYFRGATYNVTVQKEGYAPFQTQITSSLNIGWYLIGNFFIGGWLGWLVVDPLSGAMWTLDQGGITAALSREGSAPPPTQTIIVPAQPPQQPATGPACPSCGHRNEVGAKFCGGCGGAMTQGNFCPGCGQKCETGANFCPGCGKQL